MAGGDRVRKADIVEVLEFVAAVETETARIQSFKGNYKTGTALLPDGFATGLYELGLLRRMKSGEVQADPQALADKAILHGLKHLPAQMKYFLNNQQTILSDLKKLQAAESRVLSFLEMMKREPDLAPHVIAVGWWRMLNISEMPASIDEFLENGFSPQEWARSSMRAIPNLSHSVSHRTGNVDSFNHSIIQLHSRGLLNKTISLPDIDKTTAERVEKVLKWTEIERRVPTELIRFLGVSWYLMVMLEDNDLIPLEQCVAVESMKLIMKSAGVLADRSPEACEDLLEAFLSEMEASGADGTANLLFLPEVI